MDSGEHDGIGVPLVDRGPRQVRNPLGFFALVLVGGGSPFVAAMWPTRGTWVAAFLAIALTAVVIFLAAAFCLVLWKRPENLYSPDDIPEKIQEAWASRFLARDVRSVAESSAEIAQEADTKVDEILASIPEDVLKSSVRSNMRFELSDLFHQVANQSGMKAAQEMAIQSPGALRILRFLIENGRAEYGDIDRAIHKSSGYIHSHLRALEAASLVRRSPEGPNLYFEATEDAIRLLTVDESIPASAPDV